LTDARKTVTLDPIIGPSPPITRSPPPMVDVRRTLREVFGFDDFRPGQERVIDALLEGRSALAVFPTGAGKSLCYQLPALRFDGLTVVVSPLIALMKDQVDALRRRGVAAARLDSTLTGEEARGVYADLRAGRLTLLYVAPERLAGERFLQTLSGRPIALLAIDEAHCISEWGHNFRPEYLKLARLAGRLKVGRVLALTATATPEVARDIARSLGIAPADVVVTGFHRPNLELHATCGRAERRRGLLLERLRSRPPGPTIVYVTLQRTAEELAAFLVASGHDAEPYHAGLDDARRAAVQDRFMASDAGIVVATIAFGMGIDKADIRYVYHLNLPKTLENYAQEVGRAGRDGLPSVCELFAAPDDAVTLENFTYGDTPTPQAVARLIADVLGRGPVFDVSVYDLANDHDIRPLVVQTLLTYLELEGVIEATGPFYAECKVQVLRPLGEVVGRFDARRQKFLRGVFSAAKRGRTWLTIDTVAVARELGEPRERIVAALNYLEAQGDVTLQAAGVRQGYRLLKPGVDLDRLRDAMSARFLDREARDIGRVRQVLDYATDPGCLTRHLLGYFGESLGAPCGHCARCLGIPPGDLPPATARPLGDQERSLLRALRPEQHPALDEPRALARFLAGLSSPASTRARLGRHPAFGALADVPFARILRFVEG
jgi:ATP-dependent DNA helicase RecQ